MTFFAFTMTAIVFFTYGFLFAVYVGIKLESSMEKKLEEHEQEKWQKIVDEICVK